MRKHHHDSNESGQSIYDATLHVGIISIISIILNTSRYHNWEIIILTQKNPLKCETHMKKSSHKFFHSFPFLSLSLSLFLSLSESNKFRQRIMYTGLASNQSPTTITTTPASCNTFGAGTLVLIINHESIIHELPPTTTTTKAIVVSRRPS